MPHRALEDVNPTDLDALLIPGGDMVHLKDAEPLFSLVKVLCERGALLAAICSGPYVLARAGVLTGHPYTVTYTQEQRTFLGCFDDTTFRYPLRACNNRRKRHHRSGTRLCRVRSGGRSSPARTSER